MVTSCCTLKFDGSAGEGFYSVYHFWVNKGDHGVHRGGHCCASRHWVNAGSHLSNEYHRDCELQCKGKKVWHYQCYKEIQSQAEHFFLCIYRRRNSCTFPLCSQCEMTMVLNLGPWTGLQKGIQLLTRLGQAFEDRFHAFDKLCIIHFKSFHANGHEMHFWANALTEAMNLDTSEVTMKIFTLKNDLKAH